MVYINKNGWVWLKNLPSNLQIKELEMTFVSLYIFLVLVGWYVFSEIYDSNFKANEEQN